MRCHGNKTAGVYSAFGEAMEPRYYIPEAEVRQAYFIAGAIAILSVLVWFAWQDDELCADRVITIVAFVTGSCK